ncbi:cation diffusion facilitator family transporter [bacterium]|nr:cation diffusion facilitator family transporter [bacterium]
MNHDHDSHSTDGNRDIRALQRALLITAAFFFVEVIAGFLTHSLALLSDAGHMMSDIFTLIISLYAAYLSRKAPTAERTYGYFRTEVLAALFNGMTLWLMVGFIYYEAFNRLMNPQPVFETGVIIVGGAGLVINLISAWLLHGHTDLNLRAAYYHVIMDALGSIAALLSGVLIAITKWYPFDPLLSLVIGALVLYSSWTLIRDSVHILMESTPKHLDPAAIRTSVMNCEGVANIHDLHVWSIGSSSHALSAHIVISSSVDPSDVRSRVEEMLRTDFHLSHTTLQMEVQQSCPTPHA